MHGCLKDGVVTKVGKKSGKDKNRCWIKENDGEYSYDFLTDVEHWRKTKKSVLFKNYSTKPTFTAVKDDDEIGVLHLKSWQDIQRLEDPCSHTSQLDV